ncbi:MAG: Omp28-related outer membrane protein [Bacteroidia bacterium]
MKLYKALFSGMIASLIFTSCIDTGAEELIDFTPFIPTNDTTYVDLDTLSKVTPQDKNVLIEDFTGVKCSNCPDAAKKIKDIKEKHPGRVVSLGIYSGADVFTVPKKDYSKYEFRTQDGNNIAALLGASGNLPEGSVDRVFFPGEPAITTNRFVWGGNTDIRLQESSPLNIDVSVQRHDEDSLIFIARVIYHTEISDDANFINVYLAEDGIVDYQYDIIEGDIKDYKHDHVFRDNLTATGGDSLVVSGNSNPYVAGRVFQRRFVVPVKKDQTDEEFKTGWKYEKLSVVAFVTRRRADDFEVIHVIEKKFAE